MVNSKKLKIAVITSRQICYPTLRYPQYLDQDNCFMSLGALAELRIIGSILEKRPYARGQATFPASLRKIPDAWNNRLASFLSPVPPIRWLRDGLDRFSDYLFARFCLKSLSNSNVEAIYSFPMPYDRYIVGLAKKLSKPLIVEMWEDYACFTSLIMISLGLSRSIVSQEVRRCYQWMRDVGNGANRVIVPTKVFADRLKDIGVESNKIRVIPVCVDYYVSCDVQYLREKHNLKDDEKVVFFIGGLAPWHDLSTLMESIQYVKSNFVFIIAGGTNNRDLEQLEKHYLSGRARVIFAGRLEPSEVGSYLSLAEICVAPYKFPRPSGFLPGKVIRYMLAGKPIVATDLPEIREMFQNKEAGVLVPQGDPLALAQAIEHLAEDSMKRLKLGSLAQGIAEDNYLIQHHTEKLLKVFKEVI